MKQTMVVFLIMMVGLGFWYSLRFPVQAAVGTVTINQSVAGSFTALDMVANKFSDSTSATYFLDPAASISLVTAGDATVSGNIALGNTKTLRSAFGPLQLQYKSGLDAWTTGFTLQDTTGNVGIGTTEPTYQLTLGGTGSVFAVENATTFLAKNSAAAYEAWMWPRWSDNIMYTNFGSSGWNIRNSSSTSVMFMQNGGNVGIGTTAPGAKLQIGTAGTSTGVIRLTGSTSGYVDISSRAIGGSWTMSLPQGVGTAGYQLSTDGTSGNTSWTAAGSLRSMKNITGLFGDPNDALTTIVGTNVYRFHYKPEMGTGDSTTEYVGVMADEAPWAMHFNGTVVNPVNTLGYMVLGIQALDNKISALGVPELSNVIKEQQHQIDQLKTDNDELKARLSKVEMMVNAGSNR